MFAMLSMSMSMPMLQSDDHFHTWRSSIIIAARLWGLPHFISFDMCFSRVCMYNHVVCMRNVAYQPQRMSVTQSIKKTNCISISIDDFQSFCTWNLSINVMLNWVWYFATFCIMFGAAYEQTIELLSALVSELPTRWSMLFDY